MEQLKKRLIENIVECKGHKDKLMEAVGRGLIENIVECKGLRETCWRTVIPRLIENIVECKDDQVSRLRFRNRINRKHSGM